MNIFKDRGYRLLGIPLLAVAYVLGSFWGEIGSGRLPWPQLTAVALLFAAVLWWTNRRMRKEDKIRCRADELQRINLQSRLDALKNQINPHFLFNSLNSLSMLIQEDQKRAAVFVDEFSRVYRYLLRTNEHELVSLTDELEFITAYFFLLKTRFGAGLDCCLQLPAELNGKMILPLTLQLLVENAVKYNVVSPSKPLKIKIFMESENRLAVANNIQRKATPLPSDRSSLTNMATQYRLLGHDGVTIDESENTFQVTVPLI